VASAQRDQPKYRFILTNSNNVDESSQGIDSGKKLDSMLRFLVHPYSDH